MRWDETHCVSINQQKPKNMTTEEIKQRLKEIQIMEATLIQSDGHYYLVVPISHNCSYGRQSVYHVLTSNEKWAAKKTARYRWLS